MPVQLPIENYVKCTGERKPIDNIVLPSFALTITHVPTTKVTELKLFKGYCDQKVPFLFSLSVPSFKSKFLQEA